MPIPDNLKTPNVYFDVNTDTQRTGLPANLHKVLFITDDAQSGNSTLPKSIYDKAQADAIFGQNSMMGRMLTAAIKTNRVVDVQGFGKVNTSPNIGCEGATDKAKISGLYITDQYQFKLNGQLINNVSNLIFESSIGNNIYMPFEAVLENGNHGVSVSMYVYNTSGAVIPPYDYQSIGQNEMLLTQFNNLGVEYVQIEIISKNRQQAPIVVPNFNPTAIYHTDSNSVTFCLAPQQEPT